MLIIKKLLAYSVLAGTLIAELPAAPAPQEPVRYQYAVANGGQPEFVNVVRRRRYRRTYRRGYRSGYVVHNRSKKKSAAIVGGSALGGAAIGGLVGGGKGAAIGALAGGGAGLVYDRKTHKKVYRTQ